MVRTQWDIVGEGVLYPRFGIKCGTDGESSSSQPSLHLTFVKSKLRYTIDLVVILPLLWGICTPFAREVFLKVLLNPKNKRTASVAVLLVLCMYQTISDIILVIQPET